MPSLSSVRARSTCCLLVAGFFTEIAQHIHSLRARGVRSSHAASASASDARVVRKSSGTSWTLPPEMSVLVIDNMALPRTDCRSSRRLQCASLLPCRIVARQGSIFDITTDGLIDGVSCYENVPRPGWAEKVGWLSGLPPFDAPQPEIADADQGSAAPDRSGTRLTVHTLASADPTPVGAVSCNDWRNSSSARASCGVSVHA